MSAPKNKKTGSTTPAKKGQGRWPKGKPTAVKLSAFTTALAQVLHTDHPVGVAVVLTDKEIIEWTNELLPEEDRIGPTTFTRWKEQGVGDSEVGQRFVALYAKVLRQQKLNIMQNMAEDLPGAWQKWAWMMERKFDEWNLRNKVVDETPAPKQLVFRVKVSD